MNLVRQLARPVGKTMIALCGILALSGLASVPAFAQCAGPTLELQPAGGSTGRDVPVTGQSFRAGCTDVIFEGQVPPRDPPQAGIHLVFIERGRVTPLATVDAGPDYAFKVAVVVPKSARVGKAIIRAELPIAPIEAPFTVLAGASSRAGPSRAVFLAGGLLFLAAVGAGIVVLARHKPSREKAEGAIQARRRGPGR